jgi:hypothetical protein
VGVASLTACSSGDSKASAGKSSTTVAQRSPSTTAATTETSAATATRSGEEAKILAAVDGFWTTLVKSSQPPDPNYPGLRKYLTGKQLETSLAVVNKRRVLGQAVRLPPHAQYRHSPTGVSYTKATAVVEDCGVDDGILYDVRSGRILNDTISTTRSRITLQRIEGQWKVSDLVRVESWDGVAGCAHE